MMIFMMWCEILLSIINLMSKIVIVYDAGTGNHPLTIGRINNPSQYDHMIDSNLFDNVAM